jgi:hypothetical protein
MKRTLVAVALLALMVSAGNSARTIHIPSAATNYGISLPNMIQSFAVMPHTADISVKTFIGTTKQDSFLVKAGSSISPYSPCDSILIIRPTATAVTVSPSFNPNIVPMMTGGGMASVIDLLNEPEQRTISAPVCLYDEIDYAATAIGTRTYPVLGENVDGARALWLMMYWKGFTGQFLVEHVYATIAGDTFVTNIYPASVLAGLRDTMRVDSLNVRQAAAGYESVVTPLRCWSGNVFQGFYYLRLTTYSITDLENFRAYLIKEY